MNKIIVFGSKYCPDCEPVKEFLSLNNINYIFLDITENLIYLKMFLKYRDTRPEFEEIKNKGIIGIPCTVVNNGEKIFFNKPDLNELK